MAVEVGRSRIPFVVLPWVSRGLTDDEHAALADLFQIWQEKLPKNALLSAYYDSKQAFKSLGIAIPAELDHAHGALGWPARAVRGLARMHQFEGFSLHGQTDPFDINGLLAQNEFDLELSQSITSAYKHSTAFITVTPGDTAAGEPEVLVQARDAEWTAARWDTRTRSIKYALAIVDADRSSQPTRVVLFLSGVTITLQLELGVWNVVDRSEHPTGRVMVEAIAYDPQLGRPFGRSRISREVRYLTDAAIRSELRGEIHAEFFSSPQRALLAAEKGSFDDTSWNAYIGRIWAIGLNDEGEAPALKELAQSSMVPHTEMYRQLARNFAAATDLPQSSVGLFADNPESAEAMEAAWAPLAADGEYQWRVFAPRLKRVAQNIIMLRDKTSEPPEETWELSVNWTPCRYVSPAAAADWAVKAVAADPALEGTTVVRRRLGMTQGEIEEVDAEIRRSRGTELLERFLTGGLAEGPASGDAQ